MQKPTKIKNFIIAGVVAFAAIFGALIPTATYATCHSTYDVATKETKYIDDDGGECKPEGASDGIEATKGSFGTRTELTTIVTGIINGVLYVIGILAVIMVIIGGVQYTTSGGDSAAVTKAKNTILYGIVGLVIAILAYAIVNFVINRI